MADDRKIPLRVRRVIDRVYAGERLCVALKTNLSGKHETQYFYEPSGRSAPTTSAQQAIETGYLRPAGDSLFEAVPSQTWCCDGERAQAWANFRAGQ
jgi:hypothetical protein